MKEYTPITFSVQSQLEKINEKYQNSKSSHAFSSLWLWQREMKLSLWLGEDCYIVKADKGRYFFPCGDPAEKKEFLKQICKSPGVELHYLSDLDKQWLEREFTGEWDFFRAEDEDEYIYHIGEQLELLGKNYANMRTQIHKIEREHEVRTEKLETNNLAVAKRIVDTWCSGDERFLGSTLRDDNVDRMAIEFAEQLHIEGVIIYIDGNAMSVVAGFPLSEDTFDIVVSKCTENIQGLSYYSKREMMKQVSDRFTYLNLEEDLGIAGLRKMKKMLHPVEKNEMWRALRR